jgi:LysM repeat protein
LRARGRPEPHWGARLLAPAAFLLAATVAILLVRAGLDNEANPGTTRPAATATRPTRTTTRPTTTRRQPPAGRRTYTIQEGDTLDQVAFDHNTTVERLLQLNPTIDPTSLQVGQRIVVP